MEGDCGIADDQAARFSGIVLLTTFALRRRSTRSPQRRRVGATVARPGGKTFYGGYAGYFTDLDGHV